MATLKMKREFRNQLARQKKKRLPLDDPGVARRNGEICFDFVASLQDHDFALA